MAEVDGRVYIDTEISTDGFVAGSQELEQMARRMVKTVRGIGESAKISLQKQADAFVKQNQLLARQQAKVEKLEQEYAQLSEQKVETDEFREIGEQIDADIAKLNRLEKNQEEFLNTGGRKYSNPYKKRQMQIEELTKSIQYAKGEQQALLDSGGAYKAADTSKVQEKLSLETEKYIQMQTALGTSYESLKQKVKSYGGQTRDLTGIKGRLIAAYGRLRSSVRKTDTAMGSFGNTSKKTGMSMSRMLRTSLLMGLAFRALSSVMTSMTEGMNNLAQYSSSTNADLSALKSSLTKLKNAFATAFAPLLSVVTPILTKFMDVLAKALTYVNIFFSVLSGKDTYTRAVAVQENYVDGLKDTASSAEEAEKALSEYLNPLDEINKLGKENALSGSGVSGGASGTSPSEMFEEVPIENAEGLRGIFSEILNTALLIGAAVAAWKISSVFTSDLRKLSGFALVVSGALMMISNILNIYNGEYENTSMESAIKTAVSGGLTGAGLMAMGASAWALPISVLLSFLITDIAVNWKNYKGSLSSTWDAYKKLFNGDAEGAARSWQDAYLRIMNADSWGTKLQKAVMDAVGGEGTWEKIKQELETNDNAFRDVGRKIIVKILLGISDEMQGIGDWIRQKVFNPFISKFKEKFGITTHSSASMKTIGNQITKGLVDGIREKLYELNVPVENIKTILGGVISFVKGVFSGNWKQAWIGVREIFHGVFDSLKSKVKGPINSIIGYMNGLISGVVSGINAVIRALNRLNIKIPEWLKYIPGASNYAGKSLGFNISTLSATRIPYLATGAVIPPNAPFMAVLGDQKKGTNIETPESLLRQIMREELGSRQTGGGTYKFIGQINRRVLFEEMMTEAKLRQSQNGRNPFALA